jgi:hypothetical protein
MEARRCFARNVEFVAAGRGVGRSELAARAGCARSHLYEVLAGRKTVGLDCIARIAWALEVRSRRLRTSEPSRCFDMGWWTFAASVRNRRGTAPRSTRCSARG